MPHLLYYCGMYDRGRNEISPTKLLSTLRRFDLLPAIVFLPTRRKCDEAALETAADKRQEADAGKFLKRQELFSLIAMETPEILGHKHRKILVHSGVASHHAGHIPAWKLLIEKMMSAGLLNAIFATSTVAAGVDFPARTVVITNADTRGNDGWRPLSASELQQMTGRAGRRGKDNVGFVILAPGQFQNPARIAELLKAPPDPLESRFRSTYTSLLNLLDAFGNFAQVREIAEKSFAFHETARHIEKLRRKTDEIIGGLKARIDEAGFDFSPDDVRGFERLASSRTRLAEDPSQSWTFLREQWLAENVKAGRIVTPAGGGKRLFMVLSVRGGRVSAMRDDGQGRTFPLSHVRRIYKTTYELDENSIAEGFIEVQNGEKTQLREPKFAPEIHSDAASSLIGKLLDSFLPVTDNEDKIKGARQFLWDAASDADRIETLGRDIEFLRSDIWQPFINRARVLEHFGYLDFYAETVSETGKWLADVRVDRPLLVGEALRNGLFDDLDTGAAAGLTASLAADADRNYGELYISDRLDSVIDTFERIIFDVARVESKFGVEPESEINLSAAAATEKWAAGMDWNDLVRRTRAEEGDLFRLLSRTGEALLQIAQLRESNPKAATAAREASVIVLRDPIR